MLDKPKFKRWCWKKDKMYKNLMKNDNDSEIRALYTKLRNNYLDNIKKQKKNIFSM